MLTLYHNLVLKDYPQ